MDHLEAGRHLEANAEGWTALARQGYDRCRDLFNTSAFLRMLPPVEGLRGLDIGCGEGHNTRLLAGRGARMTALDIAPTFLRHARAAERERPSGIRYLRASGLALPSAAGAFDFATGFMSFQDIPDVAMAGYFDPPRVFVGERTFGAAPPELRERYPKFRTPYFRRTPADWLNLLVAAGFRLEAFAEPTPDDATLAAHPEEYDARIAAFFLIARCRKPEA